MIEALLRIKDNLSPFQRAKLTLTGWYVLIAGILIIIFTLLVLSARESSFVRVHRVVESGTDDVTQLEKFEQAYAVLTKEFEKRLYIFDGVLFVIAAVLSYFLSGKTLEPIRVMMKEQEEFSTDVSHELRTPLTTMSLSIQAYVRKNRKRRSAVMDVFTSLSEEVDHMIGITEGLLTLMRIRNSEINIAKEKIDLRELVDEAIKKRTLQTEVKKHKIVIKPTQEKATVIGHKDQLLQVVIILLDNAIKYSVSNSLITIKVTRDQSYAGLSVFNPSHGLEKNDLKKIFSRFYRGKQVQGKIKGTGLGLAIAKKIIEHHDGMIRASKTRDDQVAVSIRLPVQT